MSFIKIKSQSYKKSGICKICGVKVDSWKNLCPEHWQESRKAKRGRRTWLQLKPKVDRRAWWNGLTGQQKIDYLKKKFDDKAEKRKQKSIALMEKLDLKLNCLICLHHKTNNCTDILPQGCEYYYETG